MSVDTAFDILDFAKIFLNEDGGILIDTHIRAHTEGRRNTFDEDIWPLGEKGEPISFDDITDFFYKVQTEVKKWQKHGTYWFEGIRFDNDYDNNVKAKFCWGT